MKIKKLSMFIDQSKHLYFSPWKMFLIIGYFITVFLISLPHIATLQLQQSEKSELIYSLNHLNHHWVQFDNIVKLYPAYQLSRNLSVTGKVSSPENSDKIFPNVLQEISISLLYATAILVTGVADIPYYMLGFLVGLSFILGVK